MGNIFRPKYGISPHQIRPKLVYDLYYCFTLGKIFLPKITHDDSFSLVADLGFIRVCIDDLICISTRTIDDHLAKLYEVLIRSSDANLEVNAPKSYFFQTECKYLGHVLT